MLNTSLVSIFKLSDDAFLSFASTKFKVDETKSRFSSKGFTSPTKLDKNPSLSVILSRRVESLLSDETIEVNTLATCVLNCGSCEKSTRAFLKAVTNLVLKSSSPNINFNKSRYEFVESILSSESNTLSRSKLVVSLKLGVSKNSFK
ncbi:hypothetical protein [Mycoplasmopsis synoviae]|uniref:hypothetical protein n=1 Tax=Mycoplasmopsis synoviae TaxID=2109 RepID=UPI00059DA77F|nr:hypothetical protein [Mycoplasmopsis synoviae]